MPKKDTYKILIVEDDEDLMEMLAGYFHVQGYDTIRAHWGEEAIQLATEQVPDLMFQDIRLPDFDGFEVVRRLRSNRKTKNIPVIFLTDRREKKDRLAGLELGAVDYVTKPFDVQELRLRVQNVITRIESDQYFNPITNMPDGLFVRQEIEEMLKKKDWGIVTAGVRGIHKFRDRFGFVAADDVSRSLSLILEGVCKNEGSNDLFLGQLGPAEFIIITVASRVAQLAKKCEIRLDHAIPQFYPMDSKVNPTESLIIERLLPRITKITSDNGIKNYVELREFLNKS